MKIINKHQLKNIIRAINDYYLQTDNPPPSRVFVPIDSIFSYSNERYYFKASVITEVNCANDTVKSHRVTIKFKLTPNGKLDAKSLTYL